MEPDSGGRPSRALKSRRRFKFNILLGSFCVQIFFRPAPERQEAAKNPVGLEVESGFVAVQGVAFGGGFEG